MSPETRRALEMAAYIIVLAMLLGSALIALKHDKASDIFIGGVMAAIVPTIQAIARIGQADTMNRLADHLARKDSKE